MFTYNIYNIYLKVTYPVAVLLQLSVCPSTRRHRKSIVAKSPMRQGGQGHIPAEFSGKKCEINGLQENLKWFLLPRGKNKETITTPRMSRNHVW
jgi:hypothetical protein